MKNKDRFNKWTIPVFDKDGWTKYGWRCQHPDKLKLGDKVDIGCFSYLNAKYGIVIGDDVQIGSHCSIYSVNTENNTMGRVIIGDGVLIGSFCLILPGAVIKPFCKVRAYSIIKAKEAQVQKEISGMIQPPVTQYPPCTRRMSLNAIY